MQWHKKAIRQSTPPNNLPNSTSGRHYVGERTRIDGRRRRYQSTTTGFHNALKTKFIEGNAGFMSLVALALVLGLAFCIERIIFLTLSEINAKKFMEELSENISSKNLDKALQQCDATRGPVAAICKEGIMRINQPIEEIERSIVSYGSVQIGLF